MLIFDIETGPLPDEELKAFCPPFEAPPHPGEFDEKSVKLGRMVDQTKIDAKIKECRDAHNQAVAEYGITLEAARTKHWEDCKAKAALSSVTGSVVAIGYFNTEKGNTRISGVGEAGDERHILTEFWSIYETCRAKRTRLVGWNINFFDLSFLRQLCIYEDIDVPTSTFKFNGRYFNWDEMFHDLMVNFCCGGKPIGLGAVATRMGFGGKNGEGKDFAKLWLAGGDDREKARAYLDNDLQMTAKIAERMQRLGMVPPG